MRNKKIPAGFIFTMLLFIEGFSQSFSSAYSPNRNYRPSAETMKEISASFDKVIKNNNAENKKVREMINESLHSLSDYVASLDSFLLLMDSDTMTQYLKKIVEHISEKNPQIIKNRFKVFTLRTDNPNAFNMSQGIILVHLGLINKIYSEAELTYILCHEISHDVLGHVMNGIKKRAEIYYDKQFQKELKKAQNKTYNSLKSTENMRMKYMSQFTEHSRENECEADSLGLILFYNAGYSPADAISAMNLLDSIDIPLYTAPVNYRKYFDFSSQPLRNEWLALDPSLGSLGGNIDSLFIRPDSLKTHPDCAMRSKALERISKKQNMNVSSSFRPSGIYDHLQIVSCFERIEYFLNEEVFGEALFDALQLSARYPDNLFLKCVISNTLCEIYNAQINHRFSAAVEFPDIHYSKSYNEFLSFLQNVSSSQLKNIVVNYYDDNISKLKSDNSYCHYIGYLIKSMGKSKNDYASIVADYKKDNTLDAHFKKLLDEKFNFNPSTKK